MKSSGRLVFEPLPLSYEQFGSLSGVGVTRAIVQKVRWPSRWPVRLPLVGAAQRLQHRVTPHIRTPEGSKARGERPRPFRPALTPRLLARRRPAESLPPRPPFKGRRTQRRGDANQRLDTHGEKMMPMIKTAYELGEDSAPHMPLAGAQPRCARALRALHR